MARKATPADSGELARIHIESWQAAYAGIFPSSFLDALDVGAREAWFERQIARRANIVVAPDDGPPAGFAYVGATDDPGVGEVYAIYVDPSSWRLGHGRSLLRAAEAELEGSGNDRGILWVLEANHRARAFYESMGWVAGGPIKLEEIGGVQVTEIRYEKALGATAPPG